MKTAKHVLSGTALLFLILFFGQNSFAQRKGIVLACKHIAPIQKSYLSRHINFKKESVNLEARVVDQFIKKIDRFKLYLLQNDVDKIKKKMKGHLARLKIQDCVAIRESYGIMVDRMKQRVGFVKKYLGPKFKFIKSTELVLDPDHRKIPKTKAEVEAFLKKNIQFKVATYLSTDMKLEESKQHTARSYERLLKSVSKALEKKSEADLWSIYLSAFSKAMDPHSDYWSAENLEDFEIQMGLSLEGIGATLSSRDGFTVVEYLVPGGAAARSAQLKPKDKILAVGQADGKMENIVEQDLSDVVRKIRGPKGSKVHLKILRKGGKAKPFMVTLIRDKINLEDEAASIDYIEREIGGKKKVVGLLNLPSFYAKDGPDSRFSSEDIKKILREAQKKKIAGLVLDLSTNGGGELGSAVKIAGMFFKKGNVVKQSHRNQKIKPLILMDKDAEVEFNGPLVVLTSRFSASASEIVAGTLKDYKRAIIVGGDHTFGKGSVQSVEPLPPGLGATKTTVGMFFTAGGASTQHIGVITDISFPNIYSTDETGEKTLDYSLPPKKIKPFLSKEAYVSKGHGAWKPVDKSLIKLLSEKSKKRIQSSPAFDKVREAITKVKARGKLIKVSEILDDEDEDKSKKTAKTGKKDDKKKKDMADNGVLSPEEKKKKYLERADIEEALNILVDYVESSKGGVLMGAKKVQ